MNILQAAILGIVQGFTEFFPVSSSAHLKLTRWLMDIPEGGQSLYFDLCCHAGTLLALILYFRRDIFSILRDIRIMALFILALLPLLPAYFLLKPLRTAASNPAYLGYCFLFTALLLFLASSVKPAQKEQSASQFGYKWQDMLWIGAMQTMALLPGVSRSGSTIAAARLLGWDWISAARFSFLLAIPAILGGQIMETWKLASIPEGFFGLESALCCASGFFTAFITGLWSVRFIFSIYERGTLRPFAWYCLGIGLFSAWALHG